MSLCIAIVVIDYLWIIIIIVFQVYSIENESGRKEKSSNTASRGRENSVKLLILRSPQTFKDNIYHLAYVS